MRRTRISLAMLLSLALVLAAVVATGAASASSSAPVIQMLMGTPPQSLDPGLDYTTQGSELHWLTNTGLVTYSHGSLGGSTNLIPGLVTALPVISNGGKTYSATLRKGLVYSNGAAVKASDFIYTVERAVKIPWGGASTFITPIIVGANAYATGKASTISGITANNATGKIVIHLTAPYGPFDNVLAFPSLGLIPTGFPMKVQPTNPAPGVGPYELTNVVPNTSVEMQLNPHWAAEKIPGIPSGYDNIEVKFSSNVSANALSVLQNSADVFDWADTIPGSLLPQVQQKAVGRYKQINLGGSTYYVFMNTREKPFSSFLARKAVVIGLNQDEMSRLGSGTLAPACFFLPPAVVGHPTTKCPYGAPGVGNLAKAKALVQQSGMAGTPITVWSETRAPRVQWMTYYTQFLNSIGFKATQKIIADATYFTTVGEEKQLHPQTGFEDWNQDFPNPVDFYGVLLDGNAITPTNNLNFGEVNDPYLNAQVTKLGATPTTELGTIAKQWQALDAYVAKKAYLGVFGYQKFPFFTSTRINWSKLVFNSIYGWDLTAFDLK